ncbi:MAG: YvcK family protein [Candidatus Omnitrophica bacterium]|nr:YvcK family protein [Candidatus Omnitrophota bacterium]MDD5351804.1 YvcK family protein [Candidatus Omnitrophota bacterium]MDD5550630.1 YvcK family protein [Candidatus Omnitrophota bacterium]
MKKEFRLPTWLTFYLKWFYPGIKIKRWILLLVLGILLIASGLAGGLLTLRSSNASSLQSKILGAAYTLDFIIGVWLVFQAVKKIFRSIVSLFLPQQERKFIDIVYQKRQLARGPKIVVIGGGTGLSTILHGLKEHTDHNSAIVTVADDGGSSGKLRQQFDILPPGDIRNCLVALADAEPLMHKLFQFRFGKDSEFAGHSFGNLFITVMTQLTGDFEQAIKESSKVLAIRGHVIPSTLNKVTLVAKHKDGTQTEGEAKIPYAGRPIDKVYLNPESNTATPEAIKAIQDADIIVLGPGSLYTSIIPNLLIKEITEAIVDARALKFYICNIMTQPGETDNFTASDHLRVLIAHSHPRVIDYCIVNNGWVPNDVLEKYKSEDSYLVNEDIDKIRSLGYKVILDDFVKITNEVIRHDDLKLSQAIIRFFNSRRYAKPG